MQGPDKASGKERDDLLKGFNIAVAAGRMGMMCSSRAHKKGRNSSAALSDRDCENADPGPRFILVSLKTSAFS